MGRREQALAPIEEAVTIRRRLAEAAPDAYLPDLAGSLNNLGLRLTETGQFREAMIADREAVDIYRSLQRQWPNRFIDALGRAVQDLSIDLRDLGYTDDDRLRALEDALERPLTYADGGLRTTGDDPSGVALEQWDPIIAVAAAAARGEADNAALTDLGTLLEHIAQDPDWAALTSVIRRIIDGERGEQLLTGLDPVDTTLTQELLRRVVL